MCAYAVPAVVLSTQPLSNFIYVNLVNADRRELLIWKLYIESIPFGQSSNASANLCQLHSRDTLQENCVSPDPALQLSVSVVQDLCAVARNLDSVLTLTLLHISIAKASLSFFLLPQCDPHICANPDSLVSSE